MTQSKGNLLVVMPVMNVRHMRVTMNHRQMSVPMSMRFSGRISRQVLMLMVCVVQVRVLVFQDLMQMKVFMMLDQMHPHSKNH